MTSTPERGSVLSTGTLKSSDVMRRVDGFASCDVPGGRVILVPGAEPVTLSDSAVAVYDAIDGVRSVAELAGPVAARFEVAISEVEAVTVPTVRRFGALGLLVNVAAATGIDDGGPTGGSTVGPESAEPDEGMTLVPSLAEESSCVAQRFDLDRATLYNIRTPLFEMGIGAAGGQVVEVVESLLGEFMVDTPLPLGLMLVAPPREHAFVEPVITIFDGSGYRAWRGRGPDELRSYLLALLSPLGATSDYPRCFVDYRSLARDGMVILVHPYVLDDARLMIECRRRGWEPLPRLYTEFDCRSQEVVIREPFDPAIPNELPAQQATYRVAGIHYGISPAAPEPVLALESLARRHLAMADGRSARDSLSTFGDIVSRVPSVVADVPGGHAYLQSFRRLVAQVEGKAP